MSSFVTTFYVHHSFAGGVQFSGCRAINTGPNQFTGAGYCFNGKETICFPVVSPMGPRAQRSGSLWRDEYYGRGI
jgi:hypothetical protein